VLSIIPPLHSQKGLFRCKIKKKTSSNKPIGERGNFFLCIHGIDDEQIKFITDSVLEFLNKSTTI
jgi:hypothetical protein